MASPNGGENFISNSVNIRWHDGSRVIDREQRGLIWATGYGPRHPFWPKNDYTGSLFIVLGALAALSAERDDKASPLAAATRFIVCNCKQTGSPASALLYYHFARRVSLSP